MANNIGWISLHRQIQTHWIWQDANKLKWWLDMLMTVNSNPAKVNLGNEIFDCCRGESLISLQGWSLRWGVSKDTARNFIKLLEKDGMVKCVSIGKSTRITICKYDDYQQPLHVNQTHSKRIPNAFQTPTHPNNKEDNDNKETMNDVLFDVPKINKPKKEKDKFIKPTEKEVTDYFILNGYTESSGKTAYNYYNTANWKDSNDKQVLNWKQKMISVWFKDENKISISTPKANKPSGR